MLCSAKIFVLRDARAQIKNELVKMRDRNSHLSKLGLSGRCVMRDVMYVCARALVYSHGACAGSFLTSS